ncbi:MAG: tRNA (adenosine(37)-N6)-threonylcarbamoyltransferase complex transferase subunit TsaD [Myxococcales bacterium]|nr:tRNA (adenosine(37)-N6)-threonylcarbamoyltransferase complex transferase subunit TsaD [Myxococcales bacterium]
MLVLGLETSCDETAAALVDAQGRVLSDVVQSQVALHAPYGGVIPELASRDHLTNLPHVVSLALEQAGATLASVDAVAVTCRPGLVGALLVGVQFAKGLAWAAGKPLVGVDHLVGHLFACQLRRGADAPTLPALPFVALLVSGGHTAIYRVEGVTPEAVCELGATRDDAAGEAFDKVAKLLGLGYPGGPAIDRLAREAVPEPGLFTPPMASTKTLDLSFSGLKTQVAAHVAKHGVPEGLRLAVVCASFQAAVTTVLTNKLMAAAKREGVRDVVLGGGVAANRELRARVSEASKLLGLRVHLPDLASSTDNAAMIAYAGALAHRAGVSHGWDLLATSATSLPRATRKGRGTR